MKAAGQAGLQHDRNTEPENETIVAGERQSRKQVRWSMSDCMVSQVSHAAYAREWKARLMRESR